MTLRRTIPHLLIVALFSLAYWLTMSIPNGTLLPGYGAGSKEVTGNNMIQLHLYIFNYWLALAIVMANFWEIITTTRDMLWLRLLKSVVTVVLVYVVSYYIFLMLDTRTFNMHYYYRSAPARLWCVVTIVLTTLGIAILEIVKRVYLTWFQKSAIARFIPAWLRLEN